MIGAVDTFRGTYNVSDYRWFNLRDGDSTSANFQTQYGLLRDDYKEKPAFARYARFVRERGRREAPAPLRRLRFRVSARCRCGHRRVRVVGRDRRKVRRVVRVTWKRLRHGRRVVRVRVRLRDGGQVVLRAAGEGDVPGSGLRRGRAVVPRWRTAGVEGEGSGGGGRFAQACLPCTPASC